MLQLASSICTYKLWCQARALLTPVSLAIKMSASKLICYFSSHPASFGFWASTPPDNITLNSAKRKADQSLLDFQTGVGGHCTCYSSHRGNSFLTSGLPLLIIFPCYLMLREVSYLYLKCVNYFSRFMTFWTRLFPNDLENSAHILAYLFNSVSRQHCEIWASQFPFRHSLRDVIPPIEACLYGHINWPLAQAHHQSSVGLSLFCLFLLRGVGKARPCTGFQFTVQKRPVSRSVPGPSGASLPKRPHLESRNEAHPSG